MRSQPRDGHAMIVYKITPATGTLYIADPNYPGNRDPFNGTPTTRIIECQANGFMKPYSSALAAGGPGIVFDQIGYAATTAFVRWDKITERWAEFEKGTIGDDRFPAYQLRVHEPGRVSTVSGDTVRTVHDTLGFSSYCTAASAKIPGTDALQEFTTFTQNRGMARRRELRQRRPSALAGEGRVLATRFLHHGRQRGHPEEPLRGLPMGERLSRAESCRLLEGQTDCCRDIVRQY